MARKKGMIVSDLEGTLTDEYSYWMNLNLEMGMTKEEDQALYEDFMEHRDYVKWMEKIIVRWKELNKDSPKKLTRKIFSEYDKNYLKFKEEAQEFIAFCKREFFFFVISGAPREFCALAQEKLGFDDYFSTNQLIFDEKGRLERIEAHEDGFHKEKIMFKIATSQGFERSQIIAIGDSENDFTMLNAAGLGILVGKNVLFASYEKILKPHVIRMELLDLKRLMEIIDRFKKLQK
jgi:HAD superfamily phosphoserine phosphatase-like hydrolase